CSYAMKGSSSKCDKSKPSKRDAPSSSWIRTSFEVDSSAHNCEPKRAENGKESIRDHGGDGRRPREVACHNHQPDGHVARGRRYRHCFAGRGIASAAEPANAK